MKKKEYERPTMQVVQLKQHCHILAGSAKSDVDVTLEEEEWIP